MYPSVPGLNVIKSIWTESYLEITLIWNQVKIETKRNIYYHIQNRFVTTQVLKIVEDINERNLKSTSVMIQNSFAFLFLPS